MVKDPASELRAELKKVVAPTVHRLVAQLERSQRALGQLLEGDLNVSARYHTHGGVGEYWPTEPCLSLADQRAGWIAKDLRALAEQCDALAEQIQIFETEDEKNHG